MARAITYMMDGPGVMSSTRAAPRNIVQGARSGTIRISPKSSRWFKADLVLYVLFWGAQNADLASHFHGKWLSVCLRKHSSGWRKPTGMPAVFSNQVSHSQQQQHPHGCGNIEHSSYLLPVKALHWAGVVTERFCHPHHRGRGNHRLLRHPHRHVSMGSQIRCNILPLSLSPGLTANAVLLA